PWSQLAWILAHQLDTQRTPHRCPGDLPKAGRPGSRWIALRRSRACVSARAVQGSVRAFVEIESERKNTLQIWRDWSQMKNGSERESWALQWIQKLRRPT